ncbi:hypothetical protein G6F46_000363 [Rhizopus delemar]|uniref:protein-tyrosine-phosphatase n=2 Tax=Rhizopus TaxID=4842 RepID=A0A9P6ZDX9_9FUNG|nr:hypothetical protein G6F55_000134 [Rhizopus delemar]KAG1553677.1 hypothetical protein G6F51_000444 [Rhizopus arrhizus]KAG1505426.1 hypothetical protein G6F54_000318 [Rhizopus delemar]KAG1518777.1 hypothetical protein G6F53_000315 [Rhizopus delemar]KAG1529095.1 hypothetical protein G6F52_000047 [Rhizopus delemar]
MSLTYQSPTQHWSSENESNVISCSTNSDNDSSVVKQHPPEEFINALQTRKWHLNLTTTQHHLPLQKDILEPLSSHELNHLLNNTITKILLIDIRSTSYYSAHHIKTAIHLVVPSVILKRPSYTLDRVAQSLTNVSDTNRFKQWPTTIYIVFYDHDSSNNTGNSATAILLALKFKHMNYQGHLVYLQDGFDKFKQLYPEQCISTNKKKDSTATSSFFSIIKPSQDSIKERYLIRIPNGRHHNNGIIQLSASPTHHPRYGLGGSLVDTEGNFELPAWLKKKVDSENGPRELAEGYEQLERMEQNRFSFIMKYHSSHKPITSFPLSIASSIEKGIMNRYNNIWPYEYSRVRLFDKKDDYINASYLQYAVIKNDAALRPVSPLSTLEKHLVQSGLISRASLEMLRHPDLLDKKRKYIATQSPLPVTFADFWKMVWDENSYVIVMLTSKQELNNIKCHPYWPSSADVPQNYGSITVTLLSKHVQTVVSMNDKQERLDKEHIVIRKFQLKHRSSLLPDRTITHLQYTGWPDLSVPDHPMGLLQLIHLADEAFKIHHEEIGPVTVHCSAGCGRTGTFCVVDTVIQRLWHDRDVYTSSTIDKVQETIGKFREQRMNVVQTHRQYVFCYEAVLWWLLGYGHLPATPTSPNLSLFFDEGDALADREDNCDDDTTSTSDIVHNF